MLEGDGVISGNQLTVNSTGTFRIEASQAGNDNYLAATAVELSFEVFPDMEDQTISFSKISEKVYGDVFTLDATASSNLEVSYSVLSGPATISNGEVTITGVGQVSINANQAGNSTYNEATEVTQSFTVYKATLTVTADDQTKIYGTQNSTLNFEYDGFVNGEEASVIDTPPTATTNATEVSTVGDYDITLSGGIDNHYTFNYVSGTLTIEKATLTVTAVNHTINKGDAIPNLTFEYSGFVNNEDVSVIDTPPTIGTEATVSSDAGEYDIELSGGNDDQYEFVFENGILTIDNVTGIEANP